LNPFQLKGLDAISTADIVYLEQFTSPIGKSDLEKIQKCNKR
jgi:Diphthamide biosynthesis methyltransferase